MKRETHFEERKMETKNLIISGLMMALMLMAVGCIKSEEGPKIVSIEVTPSNVELAKGRSTMLDAMGEYDDGTIVPIEVEWVALNTAVASALSVTNEPSIGIVTALNVGTTTITAMAVDEPSVSVEVSVTVTEAEIEILTISPSPATVPLGLTVQFSVEATYSDGSIDSVPVDWSSVDSAIASISASGLATGELGGLTTIKAVVTDHPTVFTTASIEVLDAVPVSLTVSPNPASVPLGMAVVFTAEVNLSDGSFISMPVTWTSSNPTTAPIDATGIATGEVLGSVTITATATADATLVGTATLTVEQPVLTSIRVTPSQATVTVTGTHAFTAQGYFSDGSDQTVPVTWSSASTPVAGVDSSGTATGVSAGTTNIVATAQSDSEISGSGGLTVTQPFANLYMNNCSSSSYTIDYVPYGGGTASTLVSGVFNITGIHVSKDKKSLYMLDKYRNLKKVDLATGTITTLATAVYGSNWASLSMDSNGDLYTLEVKGTTIQKFDFTTNKFSRFCGTGTVSNMFDTCMKGTDIYVAHQGGISKASAGGTLTAVPTFIPGSAWVTSLDIDSNGNLYAMDFWATSSNGDLIYKMYKLTDLNNDGDFGDVIVAADGSYTLETTLYASFTNVSIGEIKVDPSGVIYGAEINASSGGIWKIEDLNGDGDALDANENANWSTNPFLNGSGGGNLSFD
jgi:uncharacterized protein YjdB